MTHINNIWAASPYPGMQRARLDIDLPTRPALSSKVEVVVAGMDLQNAVVGATLGVIEQGNQAVQVKQEIAANLSGIHGGVPIYFAGPHAARAHRDIPNAVVPPSRPNQSGPVQAVTHLFKSAKAHGKHRAAVVKEGLKNAGHVVGDALHKAANPGHDYRLPPSMTLAFLAGCHGRAALFAAALVDVPAQDLYAVNKEIGQEHPFFTRRCLRAAVVTQR